MVKSIAKLKRIGLLIGAAGLLTVPLGRVTLPGLASKAASGISQAPASAFISTDRITDHVKFLASDELQGRRAGTPEANRAADYIAGEFKKHGLTPAAASGFLEPFTFVSGVKLGEANYLRAKAAGDTKELGLGVDYMPLAFSSLAAVRGPLAFAGYGISASELQYDDYKEFDARGKIVMIMRGSPDGDNPHGRFADYTVPGRETEFKTLAARQKGALGVVFVSDTASFKEDPLSRLRYDLNFLDAGI